NHNYYVMTTRIRFWGKTKSRWSRLRCFWASDKWDGYRTKNSKWANRTTNSKITDKDYSHLQEELSIHAYSGTLFINLARIRHYMCGLLVILFIKNEKVVIFRL